MSADNWIQCPKCASARAAEIARREQDVAGQYGLVPVEEFDASRKTLAAFVAERPEETFREDYEFYGAAEGAVEWSYSGTCTTCGLRVKFSGSHPFYPEDGPR